MAGSRWSDGETVALIKAWREVRNRRSDGETDMWLPASQRSRARTTRGLATDDWRAVATAVNMFRTENNLDPSRVRTHIHCQRRVKRLKRLFGDQQLANPSWNGFIGPAVCSNTAGARRLRVLAAAAMEAHGGDKCGGGAAGGRQARGGSVVAEGGSAAAEVKGSMEIGLPVGAAMENASADMAVEVAVAVDEGNTVTAPEAALGTGATPEDPPCVDRFILGATDFLEAPFPKKRRTGASTSTSTSAGDAEGRAPSVKEELLREANARRAPVDEGRDPVAATAAEMAAMLSEAIAAESNDVAVVANLLQETTTLYREVTKQRFELQRQMVAALAAAMGGAAVPEPRA